MLLAAANQGVDSCWVNIFNPDARAAAMHLPEDEEILMIMDRGHAAEGVKPVPNQSSREALAETVSYR